MFVHNLVSPRRVDETDTEQAFELVEHSRQHARETIVTTSSRNRAVELGVVLQEGIHAVVVVRRIPGPEKPIERQKMVYVVQSAGSQTRGLTFEEAAKGAHLHRVP